MRILYVEDNPGDVELVRERLAAGDPAFAIEHRALLADALAALEGPAPGAAPEVVLLDLGLPDASGFEGLEELHRRYPCLPVVVLTGGDQPLAECALQKGAQDYLLKAEATSEALRRAIRFAIERRRAECSGPGPRPLELPRAASALFDRGPMGVLFLDEGGRVLWRNAASTEIVASADGLSVAGDGALTLSSPADAALRACLARAATSGAPRDELLLVPRGYGRRPLHLLAIPFARGEREGWGAAAAGVLVADPDRLPPPSPEGLRRLFGITPAEARLAALIVQGVAPKEAAERQGVSWNTVRRHLRSLFAKTGTSRQGDFLRVISASILRLQLHLD